MKYAYVDSVSGRINIMLTAETNTPPPPNPGEIVVETSEDALPETHYYNGSAIVTRPTIPEPQVIGGDDHLRGWASPPPGLRAKVYDTYGEPPILLIDTPLSAPDCALYLVQGGVDYLIELTADFPYLPISVNVSL